MYEVPAKKNHVIQKVKCELQYHVKTSIVMGKRPTMLLFNQKATIKISCIETMGV